jgi:hypothetical protein
MRRLLVMTFATGVAIAQQLVDVPPLQPPDPNSPYASPRDAARHRHAQTLADLATRRDATLAVRGLADALVRDPSYALAAFNLVSLWRRPKNGRTRLPRCRRLSGSIRLSARRRSLNSNGCG